MRARDMLASLLQDANYSLRALRRAPGLALTIVISMAIGVGSNAATAQTAPVAAFAAISAGWDHTCGLTAGGAAYCWGANEYGRLGNGTTGAFRSGVTSPVAVLGGFVFQSISAGGVHTCGLTTGGAAYCWGWNLQGQLGDGTSGGAARRLVPVAVLGGLVFRALSAGYVHTCGLTAGGAAYCWGSNDSGQVGDGTTSLRASPVAVLGGLRFQAISAGRDHTCGLTTGGAAYCWGNNKDGLLGNEQTPDEYGPRNEYGELRARTYRKRTRPVAVLGGLVFQAISADVSRTCGLTTGGAAYCWGAGALGDGTTASRQNPVAVLGGLVFRAVSSTCGLTTDGAAYCWGYGGYGLGDGTTANRWSPAAVSGGLIFQSISVGGAGHKCALTTGGAAYCWGYNGAGQLGDGTTTNRLGPVAVLSP